MTIPAQRERAALSDLMLEVGASAPTLCEGWTVADLAAHLVLRDRRPDASAGIVLSPLAGYAERVRGHLRDRGSFEDLVAQVRSGPPALSPVRIPALDGAANTLEYFVHHEDVRRAGQDWAPRALDPALGAALWAGAKRAVRLTLRKLPDGATLVAPGFGEKAVGPGTPTVTITGDPGELVLFAFGRGARSTATFEGDPDATARIRGADIGL